MSTHPFYFKRIQPGRIWGTQYCNTEPTVRVESSGTLLGTQILSENFKILLTAKVMSKNFITSSDICPEKQKALVVSLKFKLMN